MVTSMGALRAIQSLICMANPPYSPVNSDSVQEMPVDSPYFVLYESFGTAPSRVPAELVMNEAMMTARIAAGSRPPSETLQASRI